MQVTPIHTSIVQAGDDLFKLLAIVFDAHKLQERTVVVITSKIVSLCEGRVVPNHEVRSEKETLIRQESEYYTEAQSSKYNLMLTIKHQILAVNAGIDESNADHQYVLFPQDPYQSAKAVWSWLRERYGVSEIGVLITDSKTIPLKWGVIGTCLAHCGFQALNNLIGSPDLFGRELHMTQVNVAEALAVAAVLEMGEAADAQPVAIITDAAMVQFQDHAPTPTEVSELQIELEDDAYAPILTKAEWKKGGGS